MSAMLEIEGLTCVLSENSILNGVFCKINAGETVGLIGPNGSGKTTLFNCISGFAPATTGTIHFQGKNITRLQPYQRADLGVGRVFQNFGIFRQMSVMENMLTAIESREPSWKTFFPWGRINKQNKDLAVQRLHEVGLNHRGMEKASSLSGGQMRLLEIMRTLAFGAELFLLDEPTAGVAPKLKEEVAGLIRKVQALGKTVLVIEHDINFIQKFCDRILVLDQGRIVLDDSPEDVRSHPLLQEIYFGKKAGENQGKQL
jgi:branched-chain amino acid transport system ATP-binding protein